MSEDLSEKELSELARRISNQNMTIIAIEYLKYKYDGLDNLSASWRNNMWMINFQILLKWYKRSSENNRSVSEIVKFLYVINSYILSTSPNWPLTS